MKSEGSYEQIPVESLKIDRDYQRKLMPGKVKAMVKNFDRQALGVLVVNRRKDGDTVVLDGQHRLETLRIKGEPMAPCKVYEGLSKTDEARIFIHFNTQRANPKAIDIFKAQLGANEPAAVKIKEIVESCGYRISFSNTGNETTGIKSVSVLTAIYEKGGEEVLHGVLDIVKMAWPGDASALQGIVLHGVHRFLSAYTTDENFDKDRLVSKLQQTPVVILVNKAKGYAKLMQGNMATNVARAMLEVYNERLKYKRLPNKFGAFSVEQE